MPARHFLRMTAGLAGKSSHHTDGVGGHSHGHAMELFEPVLTLLTRGSPLAR